MLLYFKIDKNRASNLVGLFWLWNPLIANISTRGNGDSIVGISILLALFCLLKGKYILSGILLGFSIHYRLYPIIFSLAMFLSIDD